eukprot:scaffold17404_cov35-Attheya_sp.AAC.3
MGVDIYLFCQDGDMREDIELDFGWRHLPGGMYVGSDKWIVDGTYDDVVDTALVNDGYVCH